MQNGRAHEYLPLTGESAGLVRDILPVREIVDRIVSQAEEALDRCATGRVTALSR